MEMWMAQMIYEREHRNFLLLMYVICTLSKRIVSHDIWWSFTTYIQSNKYFKKTRNKESKFYYIQTEIFMMIWNILSKTIK